MSRNLEHFVRLAARGQHPAASGGEARAWAIAEVLLEHAPGLDADACDGIGELAELIGSKSWLDWDEIKDRILAQGNAPDPGMD